MPTLQVSRDKVIFKEEYNTRTMLFLGFAVVMVAQLLFFHPELLPFKDARLFPPLVGTLPVLILPFVLLNCIQSVWDADTNTVTIEQVWLYGLMKSRETIPVKDIEKCVAVKRLGRYRSAMGYTIRLQLRSGRMIQLQSTCTWTAQEEFEPIAQRFQVEFQSDLHQPGYQPRI